MIRHQIVDVAAAHRAARLDGEQPWTWYPLPTAGVIVSYAPTEDVPETYTDHLLGFVEHRPVEFRKAFSNVHAEKLMVGWWVTSGALLVALGQPDGLPLRTAVARRGAEGGEADSYSESLRTASATSATSAEITMESAVSRPSGEPQDDFGGVWPC